MALFKVAGRQCSAPTAYRESYFLSMVLGYNASSQTDPEYGALQLNNIFYAGLGITILIVAYRAFRREQGISLSAQDLQFAKESVHEGLRCLGYAIAPASENDAEAFRTGYEQCRSQGMPAILTVAFVASGMVAHYSLHKKRDAQFSGLLALQSNEALAGEFGLDSSQLWDDRNARYGTDVNAKQVVDTVAQLGFQSCRNVQSGGELRSSIHSLS